jgi:hypothetical protein
MSPIIIQIMAPIISMHGMMNNAAAPTPLAMSTIPRTAKATQPHIILIECLVLFGFFIAISRVLATPDTSRF